MEFFRKYLEYVLLGIILIGALSLRTYQLGTIPNGMLIDEPAFGYNAYSILKTGRDEHGISFPIIFKSYGDDKLPLSIYAIVPSVALFGLNHFAVRLPGVVQSIIALGLFYMLLKNLKFTASTTALTTLIFALVPWSFIISRFTRESSLALVFLITFLIFLIKAIDTKNNRTYIVLAGFFCALSWYTYIAYRFATIIFLGIFIIIALTKKYLNAKQIFALLPTLLICAIPAFFASTNSVGTVRLTQLGFAADPGPIMETTEKRDYCALNMPLPICNLFINKATVYPRIIMERYIRTISPELLFAKGIQDLPIFSLPHYGQLFLVSAPLFLLGIIALFTRTSTLSPYRNVFILTGITTMGIPSVLAGDFQPMRLSPSLPFYLLVIAIGIETLFTSKTIQRKFIYPLIVVPLFGQAAVFYHEFFFVHTQKYDILYNTPHPGIIKFIAERENIDKVYFHPYTADPIIYYAFYTQLDPAVYQKEVIWNKQEGKGYIHAKKLRNIEVTSKTEHELACKDSNSLLVTDREIKGVTPIYTAQSANNVHTYVRIYDLNMVGNTLDCTQ